MLCKECNTEMIVDKRIKEDDKETFVYKCKNPHCKNYGYKKEKE